MIAVQYANAMVEVLHYLKGIRQEDINKIPKKFISFLEKNATKDYICEFDYNKPLNELKLLNETRNIIGLICLNYWCETEEQKQKYLSRLNENERKYQEELREKYNPENMFKQAKTEIVEQQEQIVEPVAMVEYKENIFKRIINKIKSIFSLR